MRLFSTTEVKIFFLGFLTSLVVLACLGAWAAVHLTQQGVTITIPYEQVAVTLNSKIAAQVQTQLPQYLQQVRGQIPQLVADQVSSGLSSASLQIGTYEVRLPAAVVRGLDTHLQSAVAAALVKVIDGLDTRDIARMTVEEIENQVTIVLQQHPEGMTVNAKLLDRWTVPLKIKLQ